MGSLFYFVSFYFVVFRGVLIIRRENLKGGEKRRARGLIAWEEEEEFLFGVFRMGWVRGMVGVFLGGKLIIELGERGGAVLGVSRGERRRRESGLGAGGNGGEKESFGIDGIYLGSRV